MEPPTDNWDHVLSVPICTGLLLLTTVLSPTGCTPHIQRVPSAFIEPIVKQPRGAAAQLPVT